MDLVAYAVPHVLLTLYDIFAVPAATPVATPAALTVAIAVLLLLHAPPVADDVNAIVAPAVTPELPDMVPAEGDAFTVTTAVV
jgi:hypothetical protein